MKTPALWTTLKLVFTRRPHVVLTGIGRYRVRRWSWFYTRWEFLDLKSPDYWWGRFGPFTLDTITSDLELARRMAVQASDLYRIVE